ncbi:MAG: hypothetical protein KDC32_24585 [Saprospiraceae bacterium]|nr:hypothetical protein [Saprospiraceae bacterium]MCB0679216.1 hypothetical protein [Saprospiraceae bacterium]MCB0684055.1 hypothetical protein [Saprospiraceae bacterium]
MAEVRYREQQKFRRVEVLALLGLFIGLAVVRLIQKLSDPTGELLTTVLIYGGILILLVAAFLYLVKMRLSLNINEKSITYRYGPFQRRKYKIRWKQVENCKLVQTPAAAEASGWGVHFSSQERVYSLSGRTGLELELKNGDRVFLGSQRPSELRRVLHYIQLLRQGKQLPSGQKNTPSDPS